jgi:hypothetical protein
MIHRNGVSPDVELDPMPGTGSGEDPEIQKAIELLKSKSGGEILEAVPVRSTKSR